MDRVPKEEWPRFPRHAEQQHKSLPDFSSRHQKRHAPHALQWLPCVAVQDLCKTDRKHQSGRLETVHPPRRSAILVDRLQTRRRVLRCGHRMGAESTRLKRNRLNRLRDGSGPGNETYYLEQTWGIYGLAYRSQLFEIGILAVTPEHEMPSRRSTRCRHAGARDAATRRRDW